MTSAHRMLWSFHVLTCLSDPFLLPHLTRPWHWTAFPPPWLLYVPWPRLFAHHSSELSACSTSFPEIKGGKKKRSPCTNTKKYRNTKIRAQFSLGDRMVSPSPWQRGVWKLLCATVPDRILSQRSIPVWLCNPSSYPTGTSTLIYVQVLLDNELALLWYASLQSTRGAHKGKHLSWLQCFLLCWATTSLSRSHTWPSCCLPKPLLSQHPAEKHLEKEWEEKCNIRHRRRNFQMTLFICAKGH